MSQLLYLCYGKIALRLISYVAKMLAANMSAAKIDIYGENIGIDSVHLQVAFS